MLVLYALEDFQFLPFSSCFYPVCVRRLSASFALTQYMRCALSVDASNSDTLHQFMMAKKIARTRAQSIKAHGYRCGTRSSALDAESEQEITMK